MASAREHRHPLLIALVLLTVVPAWALALGGRGRPSPEGFAPWGHVGEQIHRSEVKGYQISYHLLSYRDHSDLLEQIQAGLPAHLKRGERGTHHLMAFVMGPDGRMATKAAVAYTAVDPDGEGQSATTTPMSGGYGGDLRLLSGRPYRITVEIRTTEITLRDRFELTPR